MTMKEIAALAGVSTATVSHVINGTKRIRPDTARRVLDAIEQNGYTPNALAGSLRRGRTQTLGVVIEDLRARPSAEIAGGIAEAAQAAGYRLLLHDLGLRTPLDDRYEQIGLHKGAINQGIAALLEAFVDGILYVAMHDRHLDGIIDPIEKPLVFANSHGLGDHTVAYDGQQGAHDITRHLIAQGHRRIALLCGHAHAYPTMQRLAGFQSAMRQAELPIPDGFIRYANWSQASGDNETDTLLSFPDPPTAIVAMNDEMAAGSLRAAAARGVQVPRALSVAGFDDRPFAAYLTPPLSTVRIPYADIGRQSARMLLAGLEGAPADTGPRVPCTLILRDSIAPPPAETTKKAPRKKSTGV